MVRIEDVEKYFTKTLKGYDLKELLTEHKTSTLVFSYLMGLPPEECTYMDYEEGEMDNEAQDSFFETENCIMQLYKKYVID